MFGLKALPSRGNFTKIHDCSTGLPRDDKNLLEQSPPVYICDYNTEPPEEQKHIATDNTLIILRTLRRKKELEEQEALNKATATKAKSTSTRTASTNKGSSANNSSTTPTTAVVAANETTPVTQTNETLAPTPAKAITSSTTSTLDKKRNAEEAQHYQGGGSADDDTLSEDELTLSIRRPITPDVQRDTSSAMHPPRSQSLTPTDIQTRTVKRTRREKEPFTNSSETIVIDSDDNNNNSSNSSITTTRRPRSAPRNRTRTGNIRELLKEDIDDNMITSPETSSPYGRSSSSSGSGSRIVHLSQGHEEYQQKTVAQLRDMCRKLHVKVSGTKPELIARLRGLAASSRASI
eukprot:GEZU01017135.1.p1 GENE.GEZU01017135.1~~GEZU01017135.1.p1  ORF type:complete len:349 (+),score=65.10 GEZU01017135.1:85-1131(+)